VVRAGYKQTEVGAIPDDWDVKPLGSLASLYQPVTISANQLTEAGFPVYGANGLVGFYSKSNHDTWQVTVTCRGSTCGTVNRTVDRCWITGNAMVLNCDQNKSLSKEFFYHLLSGQNLSDCITGTGQPQIVRSPLAAFCVGVPPTRAEQEAIAEALSDADALIESLEQLLAKKRDLKQGAMQELLTGKRRLPGFEAQPERKHTEVGPLPEDWIACPLRALATMKSGESITSARIDQFSSFPCYGGNGLRGYAARFTHDGEFALIGRQGALCGNVVGVQGRFFASEHAIVVTASPRTDIRWLTFVLSEMHLNRYSESSAQPGLSVSKIGELPVAAPLNRPEQTAIAAILSDMDAELAALETKLTKVRQLKQGMMQELLTGRIRLV
jgi:type I restriction enzyme, S subunit